MATSLNPDAPIFISSRDNLVPSFSLDLMTTQNPNPFPLYYPCPFCITLLTPQGVIFYCYQPTHYINNHYFSFPQYPTTHHLHLPESVPRVCCSIEEINENHATDENSDSTTDEPMKSEPISNNLVLNRKRIHAPKQRAIARALRGQIVRPPRCQGQFVRPPHYPELRRRNFGKVSHRKYEISADADFQCEGKTSLMIKNIPSKFGKGNMISILRNHCIEENKKAYEAMGEDAVLSEFDYFYLPIDFKTTSNLGYAFVNFTNPIGVLRLYKHLHNHRWTADGSNKVCAVNYARIQGFKESIAHADQLSFDRGVPDMYLPVHFKPAFNGLNKCEEILHGKRIM